MSMMRNLFIQFCYWTIVMTPNIPNQDLWYTTFQTISSCLHLTWHEANVWTKVQIKPARHWTKNDNNCLNSFGKCTIKMRGQRSCVAWWNKLYPFNDFFLAKSPSRTVGFLLRVDDWLWSCPSECYEDSSVRAAGSSFWVISIQGRPGWLSKSACLTYHILLCSMYYRLFWGLVFNGG